MWRSLSPTQWQRLMHPYFVRSWQVISSQIYRWLSLLKMPPESTDYLAWRHQFLQRRLRMGVWLALIWHSLLSAGSLHRALFEFESLKASALEQFGDVAIAYQWRGSYIAYYGGVILLLLACIIAQKHPWIRRHPQVLFLLFTASVGGVFAQLSLSFFGIPNVPGTLEFLAIAVLIPVHWRLHLAYQSLSIVYYAIVYPLTGIATLENDVYDIYVMDIMIEVVFVCLISVLSIYLYERVKRSEFEATRRLQTFLRSISHDLQTPVVGSSVVLKSLLDDSEDTLATKVMVKRSTIQKLLQGSNRQLALIRSLLEAHTTEVQGILLDCNPIALKPLVDSILDDLHHELSKKRIQLTNHITDALPPVHADANQLWRVFSNLIGNALKHNPHGIQLTIDAAVIQPSQPITSLAIWQRIGVHSTKPPRPTHPMLLCVVQDNGKGIASEQMQRLFEPYTRGVQARYMPGLGLGLYLCNQIIAAHGGDIGIVSHPKEGAAFWFTLPLSPT